MTDSKAQLALEKPINEILDQAKTLKLDEIIIIGTKGLEINGLLSSSGLSPLDIVGILDVIRSSFLTQLQNRDLNND